MKGKIKETSETIKKKTDELIDKYNGDEKEKPVLKKSKKSDKSVKKSTKSSDKNKKAIKESKVVKKKGDK